MRVLCCGFVYDISPVAFHFEWEVFLFLGLAGTFFFRGGLLFSSHLVLFCYAPVLLFLYFGSRGLLFEGFFRAGYGGKPFIDAQRDLLEVLDWLLL